VICITVLKFSLFHPKDYVLLFVTTKTMMSQHISVVTILDTF